jgi:hypothetical protein
MDPIPANKPRPQMDPTSVVNGQAYPAAHDEQPVALPKANEPAGHATAPLLIDGQANPTKQAMQSEAVDLPVCTLNEPALQFTKFVDAEGQYAPLGHVKQSDSADFDVAVLNVPPGHANWLVVLQK